MLVRMRGDISGLRDGKPWPRHGHTIDLDETEARNLIDNGMAVEVKSSDPAPVETATVDTKPTQGRKAGLTKASIAGDVETAAVENDAVEDKKPAPKAKAPAAKADPEPKE